ncbi:hypothetical protein GCM10009092_34150 [Bowmanella denitrificans]|uniref:Uncharacterized protein n=1 Tax=Bowmanella denitrificans TaxID=366582 RepID=A0ABN0XL47_9ALTE
MNSVNLHHPFTFPDLDRLNEALNGLLCQSEPNIEAIQQLIVERDHMVLAHVANLEGDKKSAFAQAELACNKLLGEKLAEFRDAVKADLTSLLRSRKAIKKYRK